MIKCLYKKWVHSNIVGRQALSTDGLVLNRRTDFMNFYELILLKLD